MSKQLESFIEHKTYKSRLETRKIFLLLLHTSITQLSLSGEFGTDLFSNYGLQMSNAASLMELIEVFERFIVSAMSTRQEMKRFSREVTELLRLIRIHYALNLLLQWAEDQVALSGSYISKLFKKETGVNFIDYVIHIRIEKAKEYLLSSSMKSYEIAEVVGFKNHNYFS